IADCLLLRQKARKTAISLKTPMRLPAGRCHALREAPTGIATLDFTYHSRPILAHANYSHLQNGSLWLFAPTNLETWSPQ
ncbi:hypothetical protein, partial [Erythrobacter sp. AP23]|uniref:hypothetical protein n=1 Tax=Erythrobacter sp. AP23 TaxID=499656 RepID=UPI001F24765E